MKWITVGPPDNEMRINLDAISYVARKGDGCRIRTTDGTDHFFYAISYEQMQEIIVSADR